MFPYDATILSAVQATPQSIPDVVGILQTIEDTCVDGDGLKWFNWLYLQVTLAIQTRVNQSDFADPPWVAELDFRFARLYLGAIQSSLSGAATPGCWQAFFAVRNQTALARIQFVFAGMNAHINHDLALAVVDTCQATGIAPQHGITQYTDYTAVNTTLDSLTEAAKQTLHVRLLGDSLPPVSHLEDTIAAWSIVDARESAWNNAELLWHLSDAPPLRATLMDTLDGLTTVAGKALLVPVP
jgi:hypothetical protein